MPIILEWFLENHVTLMTVVMAAENSALESYQIKYNHHIFMRRLSWQGFGETYTTVTHLLKLKLSSDVYSNMQLSTARFSYNLFDSVFSSPARMNWLQFFLYQTAQSQLFFYSAEQADSQAVSSSSFPSARNLECLSCVLSLSSSYFFCFSHTSACPPSTLLYTKIDCSLLLPTICYARRGNG